MSICYELVPSLSQRRKGSAPGSGRESHPRPSAGEDRRQVPTENPPGTVPREGAGRKENWM